jgi:hypothetical protein
VRLFTIAIALCASCLAISQTPPEQTPPEQTPAERIQASFELLREQPTVFFRLEGTERLGDKVSALVVDTFWHHGVQGSRPYANLRLQSYRDGVEQMRTVGDGTVLWQFDPVRNEYSSGTYGAYRGDQPADHMDVMLRMTGGAARGPVNYAARLLREVYAGDWALYRNWMPGYEPVASGSQITYSVGTPVQRQIRFTLDQDTGELKSIYFYDRVMLAGKWREVDWTLTVYPYGVVPAGWNFQFTPPRDARAVAGLRPVGL